ncbi:MAG: hypothetical protein H7A25_02550 [Leptospiraceae bacterium]|nr:hypothetical protein [Leptospiraceae bacterium]
MEEKHKDHINKAFVGTDKEEIGRAFALLRDEIAHMKQVKEKVRRRAIRAIQDAEEEILDTEPDAESIEESLHRIRKNLHTEENIYNSETGWGKKLYQLVEKIIAEHPEITTWGPG